MNYKEAKTRLDEIVRKLERNSDEIDIDELISLTKEASQLIDFCKNAIKRAEGEIKNIIKGDEE